ncbi:NADH:flavin oxidoreductase/NADH oxidase [Boletus edulis]|nr:NADH:flavin oxidoreductase/NADH oxidase [Boletus edulis]
MQVEQLSHTAKFLTRTTGDDLFTADSRAFQSYQGRSVSASTPTLSVVLNQGSCSSQKPPSSPMMQVMSVVHAKGSYIQLWSLGRVAGVDFLENQDPPSPHPVRSTLTEAEIQDYIAAYATAASNGIHSTGFDGVEIHGANGYLPDQFLQTASNTRTDKWGGDDKGRTRLTREIIDAVVDAVGDDRTPNPRPTFGYLVTALRDRHPKLAYLHVIEPRVPAGPSDTDTALNPDENNDILRDIWNGGEGGEERAFIAAGGHIREKALRTAEDKGGQRLREAVGYGRAL